jgi:hypothetical protein
MKIRYKMILGFSITMFMACETGNQEMEPFDETSLFHESVLKLTDVQVHDIFSPPVASRIYVYPSIAAYEVMVNSQEEYISLSGQLTELVRPPEPDNPENIHFPLAAIYSYLEVGKTLIFSEQMISEFQNEVLMRYRDAGMSESLMNETLEYSGKVTEHILEWANKDNYKQTRTFPK